MYCSARELILKAMTRLSTDSVDNLELIVRVEVDQYFPFFVDAVANGECQVRLRDIDNMTNIDHDQELIFDRYNRVCPPKI